MEGIDPWAESVGGEGSEEAFLCTVAVGYYDASAETIFDFGPEEHEFGGVGELFLGDAVDLLGCPGDFLIGVDVGHPGV